MADAVPRAKAILIAGPTASGKSALALALAEAVGGIVINADSMQVYRELRILTARPSPTDEARVPHRLFGHVSAAEPYSVARWLADAKAALAEAEGKGRVPIFVGGTGLYFRALLEGLAQVPDIPPVLRADARALMDAVGAPAFHTRLAALDPVMAERLSPGDRHRLLRAYEVVSATGRSLAEYQRGGAEPLLAEENAHRFVVMPPRAVLHARAAARFAVMLAGGAMEEVRALSALGLPASHPAMKALGLAPLLAHLTGEWTLEEAGTRAIAGTRQYIKRQTTWARRHMMSWSWLSEQYSESLFTIALEKVSHP